MSRKQERITQIKKEKIKKIITWLLILGGIFGGFFVLEVEISEGQHVAPTTELAVTSMPPTSGPHFGQVASAGLRDEEIPDGHLVHNLEHGDIWISYNPRISEDTISQLKQFLDGKVVITPRSENEQDIVLAAWGRLDSFNIDESGLPVERIEDFIKRYKLTGPERITSPSIGI